MNECKIVQDLLPLYAEDLVSPETKAYVDTHCKACLECANQRQRMCADLNQEKTSVDYKKNMRRSVLGIVGKSLLAFALVAGLCVYGLWEWGLLNKQVYTAPNGDYRFQVLDCDAGLFAGGARITTPDGEDIKLTGDEGYQDFQVWYAPDSEGYFACISYEDHQETWLCIGDQTYPQGSAEQQDFYALLRASEQGQKYLTEDAIITFDRWSEAGQFRGRLLYFNYEIPGGWFGEIVYSVEDHEVKNITWKYTLPPGHFTGAIVYDDEIPIK